MLQARLAPIHRLPTLGAFHALFLSSSPARDLQHTTWRLRFCLLEVGIHYTWRLSCCLLEVRHQQNLDFCCESSSGSSVLFMARVLQLHNGVLRNLDLFLKLRHVEEFPGCRHFIGDVSCEELEVQIRLVFSLESHAPRVTERQCLIPKAVSQSCW